MSDVLHIADAESEFKALTVTPDFCRVGKMVIPFFPARVLRPQKSDYAKSVTARGERVLLVDSIVSGVIGNAGSGVKSGVSMRSGHVHMIGGSDTVFIEGRKVARHDDLCFINCKVSPA